MHNDLITARSAAVESWEEPANILIDGSEKRICQLSFEFYSPHVIERRSKAVVKVQGIEIERNTQKPIKYSLHSHMI